MLKSVNGRWWTTLGAVALLSLTVVGCSGGDSPSPSSEVRASDRGVSSATSGKESERGGIEPLSLLASRPAASEDRAASTCAATEISNSFAPPPPYPSAASDFGFTAWYGNASLWTALLPGADGSAVMHGLQQKLAWRSTSFKLKEELQPSITVSATNVMTGEKAVVSAPTNGWVREHQPFMLVGVQFPAAGCWRVEAHYKGAELSYVVEVVD